jgi:phage terminase large subunit
MPTATINIDEDINESFAPMFKSTAPELLVHGGAGAGKSYAIAQKMILTAIHVRNRKQLITRKTMPSLRLTSMALIEELLQKYQIRYTPRRTTPITFYLPHNSKMLFLPVVNTKAKDKEAASRLKSLTDVTDIWIEEATELTEDEYDQIILRLRGKPGPWRQAILSFNPIDENHWIKKRFFDGNIGDRQKYTYKDNKFIDPAYVKRLEDLKEQNPIMYKVFALGEWGTSKGSVFTNYEVREFDLPTSYFDVIITGQDFGWTNPSVHLIIGLKDEPRYPDLTVYIIDEIYETHLHNSDFITKIKEKNKLWGLPENVTHYPDTAEPDRIDEMIDAGLFVGKTNKSVVPGVQEVQKHHLVIHPRCVHTIKEIGGYKFKTDKYGNETDTPVDFNDHAMTALRYALYSYAKEKGKAIYQF